MICVSLEVDAVWKIYLITKELKKSTCLSKHRLGVYLVLLARELKMRIVNFVDFEKNGNRYDYFD